MVSAEPNMPAARPRLSPAFAMRSTSPMRSARLATRRAHDGLAHAYHRLNHREHARRHWQHALGILTELGVEHTEDEEATTGTIRTHLDNL
jgi:hypothetical protein